jgi:hypothetical protein
MASDDKPDQPARVLSLADARKRREAGEARARSMPPAKGPSALEMALADTAAFIDAIKQLPPGDAARVWHEFVSRAPNLLGPWHALTNNTVARTESKTGDVAIYIRDEEGMWAWWASVDDDDEDDDLDSPSVSRRMRGRCESFHEAVSACEKVALENGYVLVPSAAEMPSRVVHGWHPLRSVRRGEVLKYGNGLIAANVVADGDGKNPWSYTVWAGSGSKPTTGKSSSSDSAKRAVERLLASRKYEIRKG